MKQNFFTFLTGFILYTLVFGIFMYFTEANKDFLKALYSGLVFGVLMGLFEVFINPRIRSYFANKKQNK